MIVEKGRIQQLYLILFQYPLRDQQIILVKFFNRESDLTITFVSPSARQNISFLKSHIQCFYFSGSPLIHPGNASPITPKKSGNIHGKLLLPPRLQD